MRLDASGLDALISKFDKIESTMPETMDRAMYDAAGQVADAVKAGLQSLPIQETDAGRPPYVKDGQKLKGVTAQQKADLINGLGIAHFRKSDGSVQTSIGFNGTGTTTTKKYPGGLPNRTLMRAVESGTSFRVKTPVVRPALNRIKKQAQETLKNKVIEEIRKET